MDGRPDGADGEGPGRGGVVPVLPGSPHPDRRTFPAAGPYYQIFSEPELDKSYADLCLLVRPEMRRYGFFDFLFEFKLLRRSELGKTGRDLAGMNETRLAELAHVEKAFADARQQVQGYRRALSRRYGKEINLRSYVVVAVGLERMLGREIE